jgi:hypothetical protein
MMIAKTYEATIKSESLENFGVHPRIYNPRPRFKTMKRTREKLNCSCIVPITALFFVDVACCKLWVED